MKSAKKPIPRSRAWQRGYKSGVDPRKMPKENPYKLRSTSYSETHPIPYDKGAAYDWYCSEDYRKRCSECGRHYDWNSGFVAGRKHAHRLKLLSKKFAADDAEYDIYANLADELGY